MNPNKLPKIELHCHLDGSLRPQTILDIAKEENILLPSDDIDTIANLCIAPFECPSLDEYLTRFSLPNKVMQSKESLHRIAFELLEDCSHENITYIEVRFAPLLHIHGGLTPKEVIESVLSGMKKAESMYPIKSNLILSCMRIMPVDSVYTVIEAGKSFLGKGVVAIDLCASEDAGFPSRYEEAFKVARDIGYKVTIHAGEAGVGKNVYDAITLLGAERIGHGIYIYDCKEAYELVKEKGIVLEVCPTSNVQTKAVSTIQKHPAYAYYSDGIKTTINTDNRTVSNTTLSNEFDLLAHNFDFKEEDYIDIYKTSVHASFASEEVKKELLAILSK